MKKLNQELYNEIFNLDIYDVIQEKDFEGLVEASENVVYDCCRYLLLKGDRVILRITRREYRGTVKSYFVRPFVTQCVAFSDIHKISKIISFEEVLDIVPDYVREILFYNCDLFINLEERIFVEE